jgi:hypothetical protein
MRLARLAAAALTLPLLAAPLAAEAQPTGKIYRIGWFSNDRYPPGDEAFQQGLRDLGWVEGRNVVTEYRFVQGRSERESALAAEQGRPYAQERVHGIPRGQESGVWAIPVVAVLEIVDVPLQQHEIRARLQDQRAEPLQLVVRVPPDPTEVQDLVRQV